MKAEIAVDGTGVCVCVCQKREKEKRVFTVNVETAKELKLKNVGLVRETYTP